MLLSSMVAVVMVVALASQIVSPSTRIGFELVKLAAGQDWVVTVAIWTPTAMLVGLAFELIEGVIVLSIFRRKIAEQERHARRHSSRDAIAP